MAKLRETPGDTPRLDFMDLTPFRTRWRFHLAYSPRLARTPTLLFDGLLKYDLERGSSTLAEFGPGQLSSEAAFVPRVGATAEDDGWLVTFGHDGRDDSSSVLVLNASDMSTAARVPLRVPIGFHGTWVPGELIGKSLV